MSHVCNVGIDHQDIFSIDGDHELFESHLSRMVERFELEIHSVALMSNHFHLVLSAETTEISMPLRELQCRYARAYNLRTQRRGPLFHPKFWAKPIATPSQLVQTVRYVHRNPLDIVGTRAIATYRWSSLGVFTGHRSAPNWLTTDLVSSLATPEALLRHVLEPQPCDRLPYAFLPPQRRTTCEEIDHAIEAVRRRERISGRQRTLAITLAEELRAGDVLDRAAHYAVTPDSLRTIARRGRVRLSVEPSFARLRDRVMTELR